MSWVELAVSGRKLIVKTSDGVIAKSTGGRGHLLPIGSGVELYAGERILLKAWLNNEEKEKNCWFTQNYSRAHYEVCKRTCEALFPRMNILLGLRRCPCDRYSKKYVRQRARDLLKLYW